MHMACFASVFTYSFMNKYQWFWKDGYLQDSEDVQSGNPLISESSRNEGIGSEVNGSGKKPTAIFIF